MKKHNLIIGGLFLSLFGCTSVDETVQIPEISEETAGTTEPLYFMIPDKSRTVADGEKAVEIADRFLKGRGVRSRDAVVTNVNRIDLDNGGAAMYVINYDDDGGFVIVSATKDTEPILAYSETGAFDMEKLVGSPVELWIDETKEYVEYSHLLPDSVKVQYAAQWNELTYGKNYLSNLMSRSWGDAEDMARVQEVLNMWYNQGYQVVEKPTSDVHQYPTELNQALDRLSDSRDGDGYTQREKSFLLIKNTSPTEKKDPMVTTKWGQDYPYNIELPNTNYYLGCVTIAVAQIMKYYGKPYKNFNYSIMPDIMYNEISNYLPVFLKSVGEDMGLDYSKGESTLGTKEAREFLKSIGYSSVNTIEYNLQDVVKNLHYGPVILSGNNTYDPDTGHSWVNDGYSRTDVKTDYIITTYVGNISDVNPYDSFREVFKTSYEIGGTTLLHMNWGAKGDYDGYYASWNITGTNFDYNLNKRVTLNLYY